MHTALCVKVTFSWDFFSIVSDRAHHHGCSGVRVTKGLSVSVIALVSCLGDARLEFETCQESSPEYPLRVLATVTGAPALRTTQQKSTD